MTVGNVRAILGVQLDVVTTDDVYAWCDAVLNSGGFHHVVTPNPEFLLAAKSHLKFRQVLNRADLKLPDGFGLRLLSLVTPGPTLPERITGIDTIELLARLCAEKKKRLGLLGGKHSVAKLAADRLRHRFPGLDVHGFPDIGVLKVVSDQSEKILSMIHAERPDVLLVGLGSPLQDLWIDHFRSSLEGITIAMGVGGAFDFLSDRIPRAPRWMQRMGLEWCFRLWQQPSRLRRILRATIAFPCAVFAEQWSLRLKHL